MDLMKRILAVILWVLSLSVSASAKEITILCTGETHAMLYDCGCPIEPDGGVSRRATLVKQFRKADPSALLLDSGAFFAGGQMDQHSVNFELDKLRTEANLKAMALMRYDAVAIGENELNFGLDFLQQNINFSKIPFVSCNTDVAGSAAYLIKEVRGVKVGIIGVSSLLAGKKVGGVKFSYPKEAIAGVVNQLKSKGVSLIILLSNLEYNDNMLLTKDIPAIDVMILGQSAEQVAIVFKSGNTLMVKPSWQGRRLVKLVLNLENGKVKSYKAEEIRVSDKVDKDLGVEAFLPQCFSDTDCKKKGFIGACADLGTLNSRCQFSVSPRIDLTLITLKDSKVAADSQRIVNALSTRFPGLNVSYLYYPELKADKLIKDLEIKTLPAYVFSKSVENEKGFPGYKNSLTKSGDFYLLKPELGGVTFFLNRKPVKGQLDLFISLYEKFTPELLNNIRDFQPRVHFLVNIEDGKFNAAKGNLEVEDSLRAVCVQKIYPDKFWDYISCRSNYIGSSWWDNCLTGVDSGKIKACATLGEGQQLLQDNIAMNKEVQVMFGPTYLLNNQEIFSTQGVPGKEDYKKVFKK